MNVQHVIERSPFTPLRGERSVERWTVGTVERWTPTMSAYPSSWRRLVADAIANGATCVDYGTTGTSKASTSCR